MAAKMYDNVSYVVRVRGEVEYAAFMFLCTADEAIAYYRDVAKKYHLPIKSATLYAETVAGVGTYIKLGTDKSLHNWWTGATA